MHFQCYFEIHKVFNLLELAFHLIYVENTLNVIFLSSKNLLHIKWNSINLKIKWLADDIETFFGKYQFGGSFDKRARFFGSDDLTLVAKY